MDKMKLMFQDFYKVMEIYFDKEIIFPYMFLNEIQNQYEGFYNDCNIYMLMLCDKLEIVEVAKKSQYLNIKYKNIVSGNVQSVTLYYMDLFRINISSELLNVSIEKFGEMLRIEIDRELFEVMKVGMGLSSDMLNIFMINIYDILNICNSREEKNEEYEVLYIGQSNPQKEYRTIFDRLRKHEKVAEVFREYNLEYRDKELMVYILHAKSKLNNFSELLFLGSTEWKTCDKLGEKIDDTSIIDIVEAMLIYHFKPLYNIKLKDSVPSVNLKVYKHFVNAGLNRVEVGINLFLQTYKNCIKLVTHAQETTSKFRILKCSIDDLYEKKESTDILYEDISDELYNIIQG